MDDLLLEAFRHNAWATKRLLEYCRALSPELLNSTAIGTYGSIVSTFNHLIYADAGYLPRVKVTRPVWTEGDESDVGDLFCREGDAIVKTPVPREACVVEIADHGRAELRHPRP